MGTEILLASLRHALTAAGPLIAAFTPVTSSDWEAFVGAALTAFGLGWSIWRKIRNAPRRA
jgi:hypothetical protein